MLENLDEIFDSFLAQPENLAALFVTLQDEVFEIREISLCTIGRLSVINPAYVLPGLRKLLIQVGIFSYLVKTRQYALLFCDLDSNGIGV